MCDALDMEHMNEQKGIGKGLIVLLLRKGREGFRLFS